MTFHEALPAFLQDSFSFVLDKLIFRLVLKHFYRLMIITNTTTHTVLFLPPERCAAGQH